jgi:hypothetical protein
MCFQKWIIPEVCPTETGRLDFAGSLGQWVLAWSITTLVGYHFGWFYIYTYLIIFKLSFILYTTQDPSGYYRYFRLVLSCSTAMSVAEMPIASRHGTDSLPFASDCDQSHDFSS